jgi:dipeptidyl aminopeptidase/acylaminoacyl peptidase
MDRIRSVSLEREELRVVYRGQKTDEKSTIVSCSLSSLRKGEFAILKAAPNVLVDGTPLPRDVISLPQPMTLRVRSLPDNSPLPVVYYPPYNPRYSGSSIKGEKPPCIVNIHGGPIGQEKQGLDWEKQFSHLVAGPGENILSLLFRFLIANLDKLQVRC